ncbi:MAG: AMP-binding protein [Myxococcales bacterium]|nr:AMP-binding protein [Myxococcales bacterium]
MGVSVGQLLRQAALQWPERIGFIERCADTDTVVEFRYAELDLRARRAAALLRERGVQRGDAVALVGENGADFVAAYFGALYAGAAVVPTPILSAAAELRYRIEHAGCKAAIFGHRQRELTERALSDLPEGRAVAALSLEALGSDGASSPLPYPADTEPGDAAMILYTSGTTGKAKGAAISHASLLTHTTVLAHRALRLGPDDRVLGVLPLTHSYGCRMVMFASLFAGAPCVLMKRFDAEKSLQLMAEHGITWVPAVPTMFAAWGLLPEGPAPGALRWALSAGAPLPAEVVRRGEARLGCEIRQGYGMTEATFATLNAPPDTRVVGSVGRPIWGIEVRVVDEAGQDQEPGRDGEVLVRGHNTMSRYLHDPAATAEVQKDGWVQSGDVGRFDAEGRLYIVDRIKDLIIRGGNNVYPSEVEDALSEHPDIEQVAVIGRPHDYYGEEVVAVVVRRRGSELNAAAVARFARERVARTKVPREVAFVEAMPLGPSGKVLKRTLREQLLAGELTAVAASRAEDK